MQVAVAVPLPARTRIAVVIPCYRVEQHIADVIRSLPRSIWRIICVDDCSPDSSAARILELNDPRTILLRHTQNQGVGGAMVTGYAAALELKADVIIKVDGDGQMDPAYLPNLIAPLLAGEADYTKGNRWEDSEQLLQMPAIRRVGNLGLSFLTKLASGNWNLFDPCNGYTAIRANVLRRLPLNRLARDYFFETSMLVELSILRGVTADIPIPARYGDEDSSLRIGKILRRFPLLLASSLCRRVWQQYFVRNFTPASLFLVAGFMLAAGGSAFGAWHWAVSAMTGVQATAGTVMLATVPLLMGYQLLVHAAVLDISTQPDRALSANSPLSHNFEITLTSETPHEQAA